MGICSSGFCIGCFPCKASCSQQAIEKKIDTLGSTISGIKGELCVECGLCQKGCPVNEKHNKETEM